MVAVFAVSLAVSTSFVLIRYNPFLPDYMEGVVHSEYFLAAQSYVKNGTMALNSTHSFLFQEPMIFSSLINMAGFSINYAAYLFLAVYTIVIAFAATLIFRAATEAFGDRKGVVGGLLPGIVVFSMISFANSERMEIGIPLMFLLLSYLLVAGFSRRNVVVILLLVLAITFGSATSVLVMIPFFLLFALLGRRASSSVYSVIPLAYFVFAGYSYLVRLGSYLAFSARGLFDFLQNVILGRLPQRVLPWQRSSVTTLGDTYILSVAYLSVLAVSVLVLLLGFLAWRKNHFHIGNEKKALSQTALIAALFFVVVAMVAYIGASVEPETTFSDIRTIAIVLGTLLLPFLLVSRKISNKISASLFMSILIIGLLVLASLRTYYGSYPKSMFDPINQVEDIRVDTFSISNAGDFLSRFYTSGTIVFDYKTGRISSHLFNGSARSTVFTSAVDQAPLVVFDINGLKYGSLYTSPEAYAEAYNLTLSQNVIYNDAHVLIVKQK